MFLIMLAMAAPAPMLAKAATSSKAACLQTRNLPVRGAPRAGIHPLNREPDARVILAVDYSEGGCKKPIVVRDSVERRR